MALIQLDVPDELVSEYENLAQSSGQERNALLREALIAQPEDLEDIATARERLQNPGRRIPLSEVERRLGLND